MKMKWSMYEDPIGQNSLHRLSPLFQTRDHAAAAVCLSFPTGKLYLKKQEVLYYCFSL